MKMNYFSIFLDAKVKINYFSVFLDEDKITFQVFLDAKMKINYFSIFLDATLKTVSIHTGNSDPGNGQSKP